MKLEAQIALANHTNRLQAASQSLQAANTSLQEPNQTFDYAGCRFAGSDAVHMKNALMQALSKIADDAKAALVKGGVEFPEPPAPANLNRKGRRADAAKKPVKKVRR